MWQWAGPGLEGAHSTGRGDGLEKGGHYADEGVAIEKEREIWASWHMMGV